MNVFEFHCLKSYPKIYWHSKESRASFFAWGKKDRLDSRVFRTKFFLPKTDALWSGFSMEDVFSPKYIEKAELKTIPYPLPEVQNIHISPDFSTWKENIERAQKSFDKNFQKVVLARKTAVTFSENIDPLAFFSQTKPGQVHFFFQPEEHVAFLGSSPERLFYRKGNAFYSEAIAGTRRRGISVNEDAILRKELLENTKELHEFKIVKDYLLRQMQPYIANISSTKTNVIRTPFVQHLYSRLEGMLKKGVTDKSLIDHLHPTPATLGAEKLRAQKFLSAYESFSRGLYAGSIGWKDEETSEVVVGIRSALIRKNTLHIFAGTGIVHDSHPKKEWEELDAKIQPFMEAYMSVNQKASDCLIDTLVQAGITYFCISPGSRSTNLAISAAKHPKVNTLVHFDERGTSFHALGYAKRTSMPAAVIVSSGTACANLLPAIMEAHHSQTPLLLLTADRPPELRNVGANQTTDQVKLFSSFVRWEKDLLLSDEVLLESLASTASYAKYRTKDGPVQLNIMFREPFLGVSAHNLAPQIPYTPSQCANVPIPKFSEKKGLILVGNVAKDLEAIELLSKRLNLPVFADILSQDRCFKGFSNSISHFDLLLQKFEIETPDIVLHFGDRFVSKALFFWLKKHQPKHYLLVHSHEFHFDPFYLVTHRFITSTKSFCKQFEGDFHASYLADWKELSLDVDTSLDVEPGYMQDIAKLFPKNTLLFLANSMPIRDADRFFYPENPPEKILANRGVSGIDGNIATAIGAAKYDQKPIVAILGDLAFLHDINSLAQLKKGMPILFIVFNNRGGGISSHLPICKKTDIFSEYFEAKHSFSFAEVSAMFHIDYFKAENRKCAIDTLKKVFSMLENPTVLEIHTSTKLNVHFYQQLLTRESRCSSMKNTLEEIKLP